VATIVFDSIFSLAYDVSMATRPKVAPQFAATTTFPAVVGTVLQAIRKARKKEQRELADALGMKSISAWSKIESGDTAITIEQLAVAAAVLDVTPSQVLAEAEDNLTVLAMRGVATTATRSLPVVSAVIPAVAAAVALPVALPLVGAQLLALVRASRESMAGSEQGETKLASPTKEQRISAARFKKDLAGQVWDADASRVPILKKSE
jgi:hypothetical protein